jgi:very-short-patch-repair endonuclease
MPENSPSDPKSKTLRRTLRKIQTPQEVILWSRLRNNQIGVKFRRQYPIGKYIVDFYCLEYKLVIEIDGSQHFEDNALTYDEERTKFLRIQGCAVLRFPNNEINANIDGVLMKIIEELKLED